jgi:hypothetical protein
MRKAYCFRPVMVAVTVVFVLLLVGCSQQNGWGATGQVQTEMIELFNAENLDGWKALDPEVENTWQVVGDVKLDPANEHHLLTNAGSGILTNAPDGETTNIYSERTFGDCQIHVEFLVPEDGNSGVYIMGKYEIQVADSFADTRITGHDCGGVYPRYVDEKEVEGHAPRTNACGLPGQWQSYDIVFQAPRFDEAGKKVHNARLVRVLLNNVVIHENVELTGPTRKPMKGPEKASGPLMLQGDHSAVAYRNIVIKPLKIIGLK